MSEKTNEKADDELRDLIERARGMGWVLRQDGWGAWRIGHPLGKADGEIFGVFSGDALKKHLKDAGMGEQ